METVKVGLWSGFYYPEEGYRKGLWEAAAKIFEQEGVRFTVLVGGLVDKNEVRVELRRRIAEARKEGLKGEALIGVREEYLEEITSYLEKNIPSFGVKHYIVTSPAYDGDVGEEVAYRLAERRKDISHYRTKERFTIKQCMKILGVYTAEKGVWMRGDYYDTPVVRVLKDEKKRSAHGLGDFNVAGPFGSAVFNPGDASDVKKPYASLPLLCKPSKMRTSENQFGIRVVEFDVPNLKEALVTTYNFKDLISDERILVKPPERSSEIQKKIVAELAKEGPRTIGLLEDAIGIRNRELIQKEIDSLLSKKRTKEWPGLFFNAASKEYAFKMSWFQKHLRYPLPKPKDLTEEVFLAFGCLHAGCRWTDMKWFRDEVPKYIMKHNVGYFVGAGDFIEGLKHDLILKGEVVSRKGGPPNYSFQEKLAAYLVGSVILKVFSLRIKEFIDSQKNRRSGPEEVAERVNSALLTFVFRSGNHCGWVAPGGFDPLGTFTPALKAMILRGVGDMLDAQGCCLRSSDLRDIVEKKIVNITDKERYELPSGMGLSIFHPEMSRTKTPSIRPQEMLLYSDEQVVIGANFHTAETVSEWDADKNGQRVCLQVGTIKTRSGFESGKLKIVDFGVGLLKVYSLGNKRIFKDQTAFFGDKKSNEILKKDNEEVLRDYEEKESKLF